MHQDHMIESKLAELFLLKSGIATQRGIDELYQKALTEMLSDDSCALAFYLAVGGKRS